MDTGNNEINNQLSTLETLCDEFQHKIYYIHSFAKKKIAFINVNLTKLESVPNQLSQLMEMYNQFKGHQY